MTKGTKGIITAEKVRNFLWLEGDLEYKLDDLQRSISHTIRENFEDTKKICILSSRQIGKSYWAMVFALEYLIRNPGTICRVIAPTRESCEDIVADNLNVILSDAPPGVIARSSSKNRWNLFNKSSLRLGALERQYVDKNRGGNASLVIYEECGFVQSDDFVYGVNSVLGPQLLRSNGRELFVSSPPEDPDHRLITGIKPECEGFGTFFSYAVLDSPTIKPNQVVEAAIRSGCSLEPEFVHALKAGDVTTENVHEVAHRTGSKLSDAFRREFLAEIVRSSTLMVIPDFKDDVTHVREIDPPPQSKWSVTIDWGGVRDKTCAILHTYDYMANKDLILDERVFEPNTPTSAIVDELKCSWHNNYDITAVWADVAGQIQVDLTNVGYPVTLPQKSDWLGSIQALAVKFTTNQILISPKCKFIRQSCRTGMFNKTKTDFERSASLGHCDGLAALMYAVRCQDRSNPYDTYGHNPDKVVIKHKEVSSHEAMSQAMGVKTFGSFRR